MIQEEQCNKMSQLIAKCWTDEGFKRKLLADAAATLKGEGVELPAGRSIKALADDDKVNHLLIPAKPTDLSDEELRTTMNQEEDGEGMSKNQAIAKQLIAKCWADEGFKRKLLADPAATLKAEGAVLPAELSIKALADNDKLLHLVIPAKPTELSDEDLENVAGGRVIRIPFARIIPGFNVLVGYDIPLVGNEYTGYWAYPGH